MTENQYNHEPDSPLKILVCYHKPFTMPPNEHGVFLPVHAGKAISSQELDMQTNDEGDNISAKNPNYCELTVLDWAWKNLRKLHPDVKYIGLNHYRRFFAFHESKTFYEYIFRKEDALSDYSLNPSEITSIIDKGSIIVSVHRQFPYPVFVEYCLSCVSEDYRTLKKTIAEKFHDYYDAFIAEMEGSNKTIGFQMFIMKWEDFEAYCEWLFAVLDELDPLIPYEHYPDGQNRAPAYIGERLLGVWLRKNNKKLTYRNVYFYGDYDGRSGMLVSFLKFLFRMCVYLKRELTAKLF